MERNRHASIISTNLLSLSIEVGQITSDSGLLSLGNSIRSLNELRWLFAMKDCFFASFLFNANPSRRRSNQKRLGTEKQKQVLSLIYLKGFFCAGDFLKLNLIDFQCFYLKQVLSSKSTILGGKGKETVKFKRNLVKKKLLYFFIF